MPDLFDIDRAFDALTHDVATRTHAPGAERVTQTARRRRTTRLVGAVAALAVIAGGGVGLIEHRSTHAVVDPAGDLPAPAPLSVGVLDAVTTGWISGWTEPTSIKDVPHDLNAAGDDCMTSLLGNERDSDVASYGASAFLSGHSIAFSRGMAMKTAASAQHLMAAASPSSACTDVRTTEPAADTELVTARASDANGHALFAVARWHERLAFLGISDPANADPEAVRAALGDALLAAIQEDSTVSVMSGIAGDTFSSGSSSGSGSSSANAPSYSMTSPTAAELRQALGSWAAGFRTQGASQYIDAPSCLVDDASSSQGETVGSDAVVMLSSYDSGAASQQALADLQSSLASCGFATAGPTGDLLVASRGGAHPTTLWFLRSDSHIARVQVDGWADPPQAVTEAVDRLLTAAVATIKVEPSGPVMTASAKALG
ncbi:hypothetical protein GCM10028801_04370 [Nocardioides maradonensis]